MRRILFFLLMIFSTGMGACATGSVQTEQPVDSDLPQATPTTPPSATLTAAPTASPTPVFIFDLSGYDPDIYQPIYVEHQPPLIARSDETVVLAFVIINNRIYCNEVPCQVVPLLYYSYGDTGTFQSVPLNYENIEGMDCLVARLSAMDPAGKSLHYYAEFSFPEAGYTQRYPIAGTIDLFTAESFIPIELSPVKAVEPGDKVYTFYWGYGPNTVHTTVDGHIRIGPAAMDVASDGRIALLNPVDNRVLIYDPRQETCSSFPLPFPIYPDAGDLAFDQNDQLMVCDFNGEKINESNVAIPYCYRLLPDGTISASTPAYVVFPMILTRDLKVLNRYDYKLVAPFNSQGEANSREAQRQKQIWELPHRLVLGMNGSLDGHKARFADIKEGVAFEVYSDFGLGSLVGFEKTPQGYLMILNSESEQIRAVWIDPVGTILKDVTLPNGYYSALSVYGDVAVARDGSLYVMNSTKNGIEIHFAAAPQH